MTKSRPAALRALLRWDAEGAYLNIALSHLLEGLSAQDRALATELAYGTASRKLALDYYISAVSERPLKKLDRPVLMILRMSLYQIVYLDGVPDHAVCDEASELAKKFAGRYSSGFVNAVLRNFLRRRDEIAPPEEEIRWSLSPSVAALLKEQYDEKTVKNIAEAFFERRALTLSVNTLKTSAEQIAENLGGRMLSKALVALPGGSVTELKGFSQGHFFVQDAASAAAVELLCPKPGQRVIDVCAAPGGKSFKAAIMMENKGEVLSFDIHESKLSLIKNGAKRLGLSIIGTAVKNAAEYDNDLKESADGVICDVPCSGLGVVAKKPDIRYKDAAGFEGLLDIQRDILKTASSYVKSGGRLLYSTCTINKKENEEQTRRFLLENQSFKLEAERLFMPNAENDGFYAALLIKDGNC